MIQSPTIPFGAWLPDRPAVGNPGALVAQNVIPSEGAYRPWQSFNPVASGIAKPIASKRLTVVDDTNTYVVGTADSIYVGSGTTFTRHAGFSATTWDFAQWGDEIIAVNENGLWYAPVTGGAFTQEPDAPGAKYVEVVGDFIVLGNITGHPNRIQWSGLNNRSIWGVDRPNQADFQDLPYRFGAVTGIAGEQYNTVFQEKAISRLAYVGGSVVFDLSRFEEENGCTSPGSVIATKYLTFFCGQDGPNVWDGQTARPIAEGKYRRWFSDNADKANIRAAIDWRNSAILWLWPKGTGTQGIAYVWMEDRCSEILIEDQIDTMSHDDSGPTGFADGVMGAFDGSATQAVLETGEFELAPNRRTTTNALWPVIDSEGRGLICTVAKRDQREGDALKWTGDIAQQERSGRFAVVSKGRVHRARMTVPAATPWTHAQGVQVSFRQEGRK